MQVKGVPKFVSPMVAQIARKAFDSPEWIFEMKLDVYRAISVIERSASARVWSRNGLSSPQLEVECSLLTSQTRSYIGPFCPR
jgi:hypothetical protein